MNQHNPLFLLILGSFPKTRSILSNGQILTVHTMTVAWILKTYNEYQVWM